MNRRKAHIMQQDPHNFPYLCGRTRGDGYDYQYAARQLRGLGLEPKAWCARCAKLLKTNEGR